MKRYFTLVLSLLAVYLVTICASTGAATSSGLVSLEEAMSGAAAEVETWVQNGSEVVIVKIDALLPDISAFLDELDNQFSDHRKLIVLKGNAPPRLLPL